MILGLSFASHHTGGGGGDGSEELLPMVQDSWAALHTVYVKWCHH